MIIAHTSDFHISRFGVRLTQLPGLANRGAARRGWETVREEGDWRFQRRPADGRMLRFREQLRLVDDAGVVHRVVPIRPGKSGLNAAVSKLRELMQVRERTTPHVLARRLPDLRSLSKLLAGDPENLNLRFCLLAHQLREDRPDHLVITGDLTDDAEGFELILEGLAPFFARGSVSCVPGNHDVYPSPPIVVAQRHRKTEAEKRMLWATFAASIGGHPASGPCVRDLGNGISLACFDSCHRAAVPGSASGLVPIEDIAEVVDQLKQRQAVARLACLHHHVVNPPLRSIGLAPMQAGMRLRNAKSVFPLLKEHGFALVLNGHRHVGYRYHPALAPLFVSSPSSTIGCQSGESPYYWRIEIAGGDVPSIREVSVRLDG